MPAFLAAEFAAFAVDRAVLRALVAVALARLRVAAALLRTLPTCWFRHGSNVRRTAGRHRTETLPAPFSQVRRRRSGRHPPLTAQPKGLATRPTREKTRIRWRCCRAHRTATVTSYPGGYDIRARI